MGLLDKIPLNQKYIYSGSWEELENSIIHLENLIIEKIEDKKNELRPHFSLGTVIMWGMPGLIKGINVSASITEVEKDKQHIQFTTSIRIEHFFMVVIFPIFMIGAIMTNESFKVYSFIVGTWIIFHVWFQWVYRLQENALVEKAISQLGLERVR